MHLAKPAAREAAHFRVVCDVCGSLSIKLTDPVKGAISTAVQCGRWSAVRGTLADLHTLARGSGDVFEF